MKKRLKKKILKKCIHYIKLCRKHNIVLFCSGISPEMLESYKQKRRLMNKKKLLSKMSKLKAKASKLGISIVMIDGEESMSRIERKNAIVIGTTGKGVAIHK